ncbi:MAG: hypothetical protein WCV68_03110 [Candidatus Paceibacterota bacterium]|jgi:hypothetical protein
MNTQQKTGEQKSDILRLAESISKLQDELATLDDYKKAVLEAKIKEKENGI